MKTIFKFIFLPMLLLMGFSQSSKATHLVGGEIIYKCLIPTGTSHLYRFTLLIYRDCSLGTAEFDSFFYFSIYKHSDGSLLTSIKLNLDSFHHLVNTTYSICKFSPPNICVQQGVYTNNFFLPNSPGGYYVMFQKCCRNAQIVNTIPCCGSSNVLGAAWYLDIPDQNVVNDNSSAFFKNYPPDIICLNAPFVMDHSAIDPDGDSLVYSICNPWDGASQFNSTPVPSPPLPLNLITYQPGYTYSQPLGVGANMQINSQTGLLTCTPQIAGRHVVAICVEEYRNGVLLCTNKRDFQFNVVACDTVASAASSYAVALFSNTKCSGTIQFSDQSNNAQTWFWDFGNTTSTKDTSTLQNPFYTYPAIGTYTVMLIINKGRSCADTAFVQVTIPPPVNANFNFINACAGQAVSFTDSSSTNSFAGSIIKYDYKFGDGTAASTASTSLQHIYKTAGSYTVRLIITTLKGCVDTVSKTITVYPIPIVNAGTDQIIEPGTVVQLTATGAVNYIWQPNTFLTSGIISNPISTPSATILYQVIGSNQFNCSDTDDVMLTIHLPLQIEVPTAFSPNGDKLNDVLYVYNLAGFSEQTIESIDFRVYDRWGRQVFQTTDIRRGWDGKNLETGVEMEMGVYAWTLEVKTKIKETVPMMYGNVSLIR